MPAEQTNRKASLKFIHGPTIWAAVADATGNVLSLPNAAPLKRVLNNVVKMVIVEDNYICKDYRSLYSGFLSTKFQSRSPFCQRLHFFRDVFYSEGDLGKRRDDAQEGYLGYSVIHPITSPDERGCIGRTVIDLVKCGKVGKKAFCLRTEFKAQIFGLEFSIQAYPFIQQNGESLVCAHAATWTICRYLSERYNDYREIHPYEIVTAVGSHEGRRLPRRGMTYQDYCDILNKIGSHPILLNFGRLANVAAGERPLAINQMMLDTYSYVESGLPVLLSFANHVMVVIGHTLSGTLVDPPIECDEVYQLGAAAGLHRRRLEESYGRKFYESYSFVEEFVVVDDNTGPFGLIGRTTCEPSPARPDHIVGCKHFGLRSATSAVIPAPGKVYLGPDDARRIAYTHISESRPTALMLSSLTSEQMDKQPIIARTFLTSSNRFKQKKLAHLDHGDTLATHTLRLSLPHFVWITEFAPADKYFEGKVVAEIVMDATASRYDRGIIYARIGNTVVTEEESYKEEGASPYFSQYRHNLGDYHGQELD